MAIVCKTNWTVDKSLEIADMNRIESNISQIRANLQSIGFIVTLEQVKTDWGITNLGKITDFNRIKRNINMLRADFYVFPNTPILTVNSGDEQTHDWKIQNIMETILYDINRSYITWLMTQASMQLYAGNFYCGEEVIL